MHIPVPLIISTAINGPKMMLAKSEISCYSLTCFCCSYIIGNWILLNSSTCIFPQIQTIFLKLTVLFFFFQLNPPPISELVLNWSFYPSLCSPTCRYCQQSTLSTLIFISLHYLKPSKDFLLPALKINMFSMTKKVPWRGSWQPTLVFLLENPMDRGGWGAMVHGITKSWT